MKLIEELLGQKVVQVLHIGSTSVQGAKAKPIIDIFLVIKKIEELDELTSEFEKLGYVSRGKLVPLSPSYCRSVWQEKNTTAKKYITDTEG